jgi:hypothetical protein
MDLSKLPKFSANNPGASPAMNPQANSQGNPLRSPEGNPPPAEKPPENPPPVAQYRSPGIPAAPGMGPEIWFNSIVAVLAIFWGRSFAVYLFDQLTGKTFHTGILWTEGDRAGQEVAYPELGPYTMIGDGGLLLFGLIVLLETWLRAMLAMGWRIPRAICLAVLALAVGMTIFNLFVCIACMKSGQVPLTSGLAAAFGGFIVADLRRAMRMAAI